jgi:tRNA-dihydrouridine synthase
MPDLDLARELVASLNAPVILSGGMNDPDSIEHAFQHTGCEAVMLARGALGNPWLFARLLGTRDEEPTTQEVLDELEWVMQRAVEHLGERRAGRYLRKFYPWYVERIGGTKALQAALQATDTVDDARAVLATSPQLSAAA